MGALGLDDDSSPTFKVETLHVITSRLIWEHPPHETPVPRAFKVPSTFSNKSKNLEQIFIVQFVTPHSKH
jgi:hypothetical protein